MIEYKATTRDKIVVWVATQVLRLATPGYRGLLEGAWKYGLNAAARDEKEGREVPKHWSEYVD